MTLPGFLDVGFTRNFASSQAFEDKKTRFGFGNDIIPIKADQGFDFAAHKAEIAKKFDVYAWFGIEAYRLLFYFLDWAVNDETVRVDAMAYDFNEPDILARLETFGDRLRIIIDDSADHGDADSAESQAAARLIASAGQDNVHRGHFQQPAAQQGAHRQAHERRSAAAGAWWVDELLFPRPRDIQANNMYEFTDPDVAGLFADMFDEAFTDMAGFSGADLAAKWHAVKKPGQPTVKVCFSPHKSSNLLR